MSRPLLLSALALVAGIVVADQLFYDAAVAVPHGLCGVLWGICAMLVLLAVWDYQMLKRGNAETLNDATKQVIFNVSAFPRFHFYRHLFAVLVALFFLVLGFMRYAMVAEQTQAAWAAMARPPVNRGNPDEFDYRRWRWVQGEPDSTSWSFDVKRYALRQRERLLERYRLLGLQDEELAVVAAMTLGDRSLLTAGTRDLYAEAGASHLLALSGLHLGILTGVFSLLLGGPLVRSRWRWPVSLLTVVCFWCYVCLAGMPTSLLRAAIMSTWFVLTSVLRRQSRPLNNLLLTMFLMLLVWPMCLFDVGAQLSFASVAGICICFPWVQQFFFDRWHLQMFKLDRWHLLTPLRLLCVSLAAQMFTLPLVMATFHRIPIYGVLFSVLLIPLTTLLMYVALAVLVVGGVWLSAGKVLALLLTWLVSAQLWVMRVETSLPYASINDFWSRKAEPQLVVYHNRPCPTLHLIASPSQSWLLMPQPERADSGMYYIRHNFWQRRLTAEPQVLTGLHSVAVLGMTAVMVNHAVTHKFQETSKPQETQKPNPASVDILWLTRGFRGGKLDGLAQLYRPRLLVLDASLVRWQRQALRKEATHMGWPVYDVAEQGALRLALKEIYSEEKNANEGADQ